MKTFQQWLEGVQVVTLDYLMNRLIDYHDNGVGQVTHMVAEAANAIRQPGLNLNDPITKKKYDIAVQVAKFESLESLKALATEAKALSKIAPKKPWHSMFMPK